MGNAGGAKGGYKSRRGVRLEGHIDHILRRRIVLRERELIPKGLRPSGGPAETMGVGLHHPPAYHVAGPEVWERFSTPAGTYGGVVSERARHLQGEARDGDGRGGPFLGSTLASMPRGRPPTKLELADHHGTHGSFDLAFGGAGAPYHCGGVGLEGDAQRNALLWSAGDGACDHERSASLLDMLRLPHGQPPASPGSGLCSFSPLSLSEGLETDRPTDRQTAEMS